MNQGYSLSIPGLARTCTLPWRLGRAAARKLNQLAFATANGVSW
jgi:hypothetical protein